jgi:LDH2 family malate/lactate/ureidoglycolate dehydrogenase
MCCAVLCCAVLCCAVLCDTGFTRSESERYDQKKVAHFVGAIRPDLFQPFDEFTAAMDGMVRVVKNTPPRPGVERVVYPGQVEHETLLQRSEHGIPLAQVVVDDLRALAEMYGLADELVLLPPPPPPPIAPPAAAAPAAGAKL